MSPKPQFLHRNMCAESWFAGASLGTVALMTISMATVAGCVKHESQTSVRCVSNSPQPTPQLVPSRATARPAGRIIKASWYGETFSGRLTASGERFDPNRMTAASKILPIGSIVHVTNLENGRSVTVRINDRGPYVRGRSLDLSHRAAREIGLTKKGVASVRVTPVPVR
jgi:rare lipoprotein A (peptidoglycan hydrolase)